MKPIAELTDIEQETVMLIHGYIAQNQISPTVREVMKLRGLKSTGAMLPILESLRSKQWVTWTEGKARSIKLWFQTEPKPIDRIVEKSA